MKFPKLPKISQTTISGAVGMLAGIVYVLMPYLQHSPNPKVQAVVGVLMALGFGNAGRAAPDQSQAITADQFEGKDPRQPVLVGDIVKTSPPPAEKVEPPHPIERTL